MQEGGVYSQIMSYLLPADLSNHFEVVKAEALDGQVHIYPEERAEAPAGYALGSLEPNGFYQESVLQDFPLRDKGVYLHVKRRRWTEKGTGKSVSKEWNLVAVGTRYSKEFAAFLKEVLG
jgi:hypothetical protein